MIQQVVELGRFHITGRVGEMPWLRIDRRYSNAGARLVALPSFKADLAVAVLLQQERVPILEENGAEAALG